MAFELIAVGTYKKKKKKKTPVKDLAASGWLEKMWKTHLAGSSV